jgi:hypothetical protein
MKTILLLIGILAAISPCTSVAAEPLSPLAKAEQIMVPKVSFKKATVHEAVRFLTRISRNLDPEKTGIEIVYAGPADDETRITMDLASLSVAAAAKKIAEAAKAELRVEAARIVLESTMPPVQGPVGPTNKGIPSLPATQIPGLNPIPVEPVPPKSEPKASDCCGELRAGQGLSGTRALTNQLFARPE